MNSPVIEARDDNNRPKRFLLRNHHLVSDVSEDCRLQEEAYTEA